MNENVLIKSTHYSLKGKLKLIFAVMTVISILIALIDIYDNVSWSLEYAKENYIEATTGLSRYNYEDVICKKHIDKLLSETTYISDLQNKMEEIQPNFLSYALCNGINVVDELILFALIPYGIFIIILLIDAWLSGFSLIVTNIRAYGKIPGKRVDLPIDSISSVSTSWMKGICIGTSSGRINFKCVKNQEEVHSVISELLIKRNQEMTNSDIQSVNFDDELKRLKTLFDEGIITQEEFDAKKKQLLGL